MFKGDRERGRNPVYFQDFFNLYSTRAFTCSQLASQSCLFSGFFQLGGLETSPSYRSTVAILFIFRIFSTQRGGKYGRKYAKVSQSCLFSGFFQQYFFNNFIYNEKWSQSCLFSGFFQLTSELYDIFYCLLCRNPVYFQDFFNIREKIYT